MPVANLLSESRPLDHRTVSQPALLLALASESVFFDLHLDHLYHKRQLWIFLLAQVESKDRNRLELFKDY